MINLLIAFLLKHFIVDFLMQGPYQYKNKGTFLHPGGLLHVLLHGLATTTVLAAFGLSLKFVILASLFDSIVHYFVDFSKVNICRHFNLKPDNSEWFWHLMGFDQLLHMLTYVAIIANASS